MKSDLLKDFLSYGTVGVLAKFVGYFTIPIYTRFLSQADFGILEIVSVFMTFLPFLSTFQLESSFLRLFYEKKTLACKKKLFSTGLWAIIFCSIVLTGILITFNSFISTLILKSSEYSCIFTIAVLELLFKNILGYSIVVFRVEFNRRGYASFNLFYILFNAILGVLFVVFLGYGIVGLIFSRSVVTFFFSILALIKSNKYLSYSFSRILLKEMLTYGIPLIPVLILHWGQKYISRILIIVFFSLDKMGEYSIAIKVVFPILLLTQSLRMAWHPFTFDNFEKSGSKALFNDFFNVFSFITSIIVVVLIFFSKELLVLFASEKFIESHALIGIIAVGYVMSGMSDLISAGILIRKKNIILSFSSGLGALIGCTFMYLLSVKVGIIGIVIGQLIGELIKYVVVACFVKKFFSDYFKFNRTTFGVSVLLLLSYVTNSCVFVYDYSFINKVILSFFLITLFILFYLFRNYSLIRRIKVLVSKGVKI